MNSLHLWPVLQGPILWILLPIPGSRGPIHDWDESFENKVGEKWHLFIFGSGSTLPGGSLVANYTHVARALVAPLLGRHENMLFSFKAEMQTILPAKACLRNDEKRTSNIFHQNDPLFFLEGSSNSIPFHVICLPRYVSTHQDRNMQRLLQYCIDCHRKTEILCRNNSLLVNNSQ